MKEKQDYFLGLDIGTDSVGWAVTDTEYNLLKANQKALWGIRLFDEAKTAEERRVARTGRRRIARRRQRIKWLQEIFDEEICKVDPAFFQRLEESDRVKEDRDPNLVAPGLFVSEEFNDKDYHKKYPTVYHLRKALIEEGNSEFDVRLVYLALHHIIKNRGHFLFDGSLGDDAQSFDTALEELKKCVADILDLELKISDINDFKEKLKDRKIGITARKKDLCNLTGATKNKKLEALMNLLSGGTTNLSELFGDDTLKEAGIKSFKLSDDFEANQAALEEALDDRMELIYSAKKLYDWAVLEDILQGKEYISFAKVDSYEKHREDLKILKRIVRKYIPEEYNEIFKSTEQKANYAAYVGNAEDTKICTYEDFSKYICKKLAPVEDKSEDVRQTTAELRNGTFLPKQRVKDNSVIPNQINRRELVKILENASRYLPFLTEQDENGQSAMTKIIAIFDFRIPYYVGPLNSASKFAWVERKEGKIFPWNFEQIVDLNTSAERFVARMTSRCTYIGEPVLPKDSLLYSEFMVLNELNNLTINGKRVSIEIRDDILQNLFCKNKKVTGKKLRDYLISCGKIGGNDVLGGFDNDFKSSLNTHIIFRQLITKLGKGAAEDIIRHIVLFGEDRKLMRRWLRREYGDKLTEDDLSYILKQKFSGWGRLSRKFLTEIYHIEDTGEAVSIIEMMRRTTCNLMELLSGKYGYVSAIEVYRQEHDSMTTKSVKEFVDNSYASPGIKRAIIQTIGITDEIVKIMGGKPPKRVFVEMARGDDKEKKRTVSRKNSLLALYKKCGEDANPLFAQLEAQSDSQLRRDKLYLYYTQLGKSMYSGKPIDIERLDTDYDIDHIFPQSKVKDDSISNRVLVERDINGKKDNRYPLDQSIRDSQAAFWYWLKQKDFIDQK